MAEILVVDDDQSVASAFERFLRNEGYAYRIASNAEDAVRMIAASTPDLVVMDIRMPGVDGLQALQEIRAGFPDVYVVMMTAYGHEPDVHRRHPCGRVRLPHQAARSRSAQERHRQGARRQADSRQVALAGRGRAPGQPGRRHAGDARRLQDDRTPGDQRRPGAHHRRARHRQAARRRDDPRQQRAARSAVPLARLQLHAGERARGRAVQPCRRHRAPRERPRPAASPAGAPGARAAGPSGRAASRAAASPHA